MSPDNRDATTQVVLILALLALVVFAVTMLLLATTAGAWSGQVTPRRADRDADVWVWTEAERLNNQQQLTRPPAAPWSVWDDLAECESGGNWQINTGNGFYGGLQFTLTSWRAVGGTGYPHQHSREEQIGRGVALQRIQGWGAWPACSRRLGLR